MQWLETGLIQLKGAISPDQQHLIFAGKGMEIRLTCFGQTLYKQVEADCTIGDLKVKLVDTLSDAFGSAWFRGTELDVDNIRLIFKDNVLQASNQTLTGYDIQDQSTIRIVNAQTGDEWFASPFPRLSLPAPDGCRYINKVQQCLEKWHRDGMVALRGHPTMGMVLTAYESDSDSD